MRETHYVLEDGSTVHPSEVSVNDNGRLAHENGLVQMRDDGETPRSRGVDVDDKPKAAKKAAALSAEDAAKFKEAWNKPADGARSPAYLEPEPAPAKVTADMNPERKPAPVKKPRYKTRGK